MVLWKVYRQPPDNLQLNRFFLALDFVVENFNRETLPDLLRAHADCARGLTKWKPRDCGKALSCHSEISRSIRMGNHKWNHDYSGRSVFVTNQWTGATWRRIETSHCWRYAPVVHVDRHRDTGYRCHRRTHPAGRHRDSSSMTIRLPALCQYRLSSGFSPITTGNEIRTIDDIQPLARVSVI